MISYLVFGCAAVILLVLVVWTPEEGTVFQPIKSYFVILIGVLLTIFSLAWTIRRLGYPELALGDGLLFAVLGAGTAFGALLRFRPYWQVASGWPLFAQLPERVRQWTLVAAGLAILWLGIYGMSAGRTAYRDCALRYREASNVHDSLGVRHRVPDPALSASSGSPPYTCDELLDLH